MRVSVVQMNAGHDKAEKHRAGGRPDRGRHGRRSAGPLSLPEMWSCLGGNRTQKFAEAEDLPPPGSNRPGGPAYEFLRGIARERQIHVHGGSIAERAGDKLYNTTLVFDPQGSEIGRYRKIHLFDIVTPDGTGYRESNVYGSGDEIVTCEANGVKLGLRHLLRCAVSGVVPRPAPRRRRADLPAVRLHRADGQGPLGDADPRPRHRDPMLVWPPPRPVAATPPATARPATPTATRWSATPGDTWSRKSPTAPAGRPRASIRRSPRKCGATCRCWSIGNSY